MSRRPNDLDAFERKVRPIYDALDSRNWKGALKICQQALQKYPNSELVKVLKAIGLERSGKREEANQAVDEVLALSPTDEQVLRLSAIVLRASGRLSDITRMYEAAAAAMAPRGGELALVMQHEVFGSYVREQNFVKQQQVALKLSKAAAAAAAAGAADTTGVSGERYGWWVVLSILLQARAALRSQAAGLEPPPGQVAAVAMAPEKLLALAEGMVARQAAKDGRLEGYEALMVYVDVLLAQGKAAAALDVVSGPLGASALRLPAERLQLRAVLSALCGDLRGAADLLQEGLELNPDDWGALLLLLDCLLPGTAAAASVTPRTFLALSSSSHPPAAAAATAGAVPARFAPRHPLILISGGLAEQLPPAEVSVTPDGGCSPEAFSEAEGLLQKLVEKGGRVTPEGGGGGGAGGRAMIMRGPDLALVDLACRRHRAATAGLSGGLDAVDSEAAVVDAILSYYRKYGSLVSCAVDLRSYVSQLGADAAARLAAAIQAEADAAAAATATADGSGAALSYLRRRVCAAQLRDDLGLPRLASCEEGVALCRELLELYGTAQPLQAGLDERERGAADELPVLAAAALVTSAALAPSDAAAVPYMLAAYGVLADAVRVRPYGAAMRISMASLASLLAAPAAAAAHITKLDVKHIQLDTLGAHLLLPPLLTWPHGGAAAAELSPPSPPSSSYEPSSTGHAHHHHNHQHQNQHQQLLQEALREARALFEDHDRDAGESIFTAYGHGMYTKVLEFTAFRERLAAAHTLAVVRAERGVVDCLQPAGSSSSSSGSSSNSISNSSGEGLPSVEGMRDAAVAAARLLPPQDLPAASSLRFNWDLTTRPAWLPPCAAGPSGEVVEWWRSRAAGRIRGQGFGSCWWSSTGGAEGPSAAAAQWCAAQASAAVHRWLLPHCIAGALGAGQVRSKLMGLREAVAELESRLPKKEENVVVAEAAGCSDGIRTAVGMYELRRLDVKLYGAALAMQDALERDVAGSLSDVLTDVAVKDRLDPLMVAVGQLATAASDDLTAATTQAAAWGGVLPGGSLAVLSLLLREQMPVAVCCIKWWQSSLRALRKRRGKAGAALEAGAQRLADAVELLERELGYAARRCGVALSQAAAAAAAKKGSGGGEGGQESPAGVAAAVMRHLKGYVAPILSPAASASLEALIREQRVTLLRLARQAAAVEAALA